MKIIIVESPTKSKTISRFLNKEYKILSSFGHIRDLPKTELGVDVEHNFKPKYVIPPKAKQRISALKKAVEESTETILATDEDREGEAIAWHLKEVLNLKKPKRIVFHEITKKAIESALIHPREIDMNLVDAQQARRILDRLVGYKLSPFLWKKVTRKLSAGRVQSAAVRLIVEREEEIKNFVPQEYWSIESLLQKQTPNNLQSQTNFKALLTKKQGKTIPKLGIKSKKEADKIVQDLKKAEYKITNIEKKEIKKNPLPPFTTSTLQQEAWKKFRFPAKLTMRTAQKLYETGLITYHRTDSLNLSQLSLNAAKKFIENNLGKKYWPGYFRKYKSKGKTQEAHEAIRPVYPEKKPEELKLEKNHFRLYELIWKRFIASQMASAVFDSVSVEIEAKNYTFKATGQTLKFDGFLKIYPLKIEEKELPELREKEILKLLKLLPSQHFTQPPARYTEATLIKELEEHGIGRPSTYAPIISTIQERNYVAKNEEKKFYPTEIGIIVNDILVKHFPEIVDINFTAQMEEDLDKIALGKEKWTNVCAQFYKPFEKKLEKKYKEVSKKEITEKPTKKTCPKCKAKLVERLGKFGRFYACSNFPKCQYTEPLKENDLNLKCPKCRQGLPAGRQGKIVEKRTKKGKIFYGCDRYPDCDFALWDKPVKGKNNEIEKCPKCGSPLVEKNKKIKCSNKNCDFVKNMVNR